MRFVYLVLLVLHVAACSRGVPPELAIAVKEGNVEALDAAIQNGQDVNACVGYEGCTTLLDLAARRGRLQMTRRLVDAGAQINGRSPNAVYWASLYGHEDTVAFLVQRGGFLECDDIQFAALRRKPPNGDAPIIRRLVDARLRGVQKTDRMF